LNEFESFTKLYRGQVFNFDKWCCKVSDYH
jgi:hypothetical protein